MKSTWEYRKKFIAAGVISAFTVIGIAAFLLQYSQYNRKVTLDVSSFTSFSPNPEIQFCIDDIYTQDFYTQDGYTCIKGWMIKEKSRLHPSDINIVLYDLEKGTYIQVPTSNLSRSDLAPTYGKNYVNFGFVATINNEYLSSSPQEVFIQYQLNGETPLQPTGQTFTLEDLLNE